MKNNINKKVFNKNLYFLKLSIIKHRPGVVNLEKEILDTGVDWETSAVILECRSHELPIEKSEADRNFSFLLVYQ